MPLRALTWGPDGRRYRLMRRDLVAPGKIRLDLRLADTTVGALAPPRGKPPAAKITVGVHDIMAVVPGSEDTDDL